MNEMSSDVAPVGQRHDKIRDHCCYDDGVLLLHHCDHDSGCSHGEGF